MGRRPSAHPRLRVRTLDSTPCPRPAVRAPAAACVDPVRRDRVDPGPYDAGVISPDAPRLIVAAAIVDHLERPRTILAARRSAPKSLAGRWEFPGGKIEAGETPQAALHRELAEELGVEVSLGDRLPGPESGWPVANGYRMHVWFARITSGVPAPLQDHDELRWLTLPEAFSVPWLEPDVPIVTALLDELSA
ncbi:NUDIX domain-containing protein [Pseudactinotalea sp. HY160]|nr:NUDIX domain-containing protein [Pseudactinotalea sp. HY160]